MAGAAGAAAAGEGPSDGPADVGSKPLAGLSVIELHAIGPVPFAGQLLATLGAQVLRISPPADPGLGVGLAAEFDLLNFGKGSQAIDLKTPAGLAETRALIDRADVLLEGFRPGVIERLGLSPETLLETHPRLVIGRLSGWGSSGPLAQRAGHDINYLAMSGLLGSIGDERAPVPPLNLVADFGGGAMHLLVGVLAKLVRRSIDGRGGVVETSLLAGSIGLAPMFYGMIAGGVWRLGRADNLLDGAAPFYRCYRAACGRFIAVGALEPKFYRLLLAVLGLDSEIDAARQYDRATWPTTAARIAERIARRSRDDWARAAEGTDACLSPVLDLLEAAHHPHNLANRLHAAEPFPQPAPVIRFAGPGAAIAEPTKSGQAGGR